MQSSCTKPDLEAGEANLGNKQDLQQQNQNKFLLGDIKLKHDQYVKESVQIPMHNGEAYGINFNLYGSSIFFSYL